MLANTRTEQAKAGADSLPTFQHQTGGSVTPNLYGTYNKKAIHYTCYATFQTASVNWSGQPTSYSIPEVLFKRTPTFDKLLQAKFAF